MITADCAESEKSQQFVRNLLGEEKGGNNKKKYEMKKNISTYNNDFFYQNQEVIIPKIKNGKNGKKKNSN